MKALLRFSLAVLTLFAVGSVQDALAQSREVEPISLGGEVLDKYIHLDHLLDPGDVVTVDMSTHFPKYAYNADSDRWEKSDDGSAPATYAVWAPEADDSLLAPSGSDDADVLIKSAKIVEVEISGDDNDGKDLTLTAGDDSTGVVSYVITGTYEGDEEDKADGEYADSVAHRSITLRVMAAAPEPMAAPAGYDLPRAFTPSDGEVGDRFGWSAAYDEARGLLVVGTWNADVGDFEDAGKAYVYDTHSGEELAVLSSPEPQAFGFFGYNVAMMDSTIFVSAHREIGFDPAKSDGGRVYTFIEPAGGWGSQESHEYAGVIVQRNQRESSGRAGFWGEQFGVGLAVVKTPADTTRPAGSVLLAIGAPGGHWNDAGQVFVIERAPNDWRGTTVLDETKLGVDGADTEGLVAYFRHPRNTRAGNSRHNNIYGGYGLAFSGDSKSLFVGAQASEATVMVPSSIPQDFDRGAVYVYEDWREAAGRGSYFDAGGHYDAILSAFDDVSSMRMGRSIGVSWDGSTVVANGNGCLTRFCQNLRTGNKGHSGAEEQVWPGAAYVFERPVLGWGTWEIGDEVLLRPHGGVPGDLFGQTVAISADGSKIAAGFANRLDGGVGSAYVFTEPSVGWGLADGSEVDRYEVTNRGITGDYAGFGRVLAMSGDGTELVVGHHGHVEGYHGYPGNPQEWPIAGAVYLYPRTGTNQAPVLVSELDDLTVSLDTAPDAIDLTDHFEDPDNDVLSFSATSSDEGVLEVSVDDVSMLTLSPLLVGKVTVTVTASDVLAEAMGTFEVRVGENTAPILRFKFPDQTILAGRANVRHYDMDAIGAFTDVHGDPLTYSAESSDSLVVTASVAGSVVTLEGIMPGQADVVLTATDPDSLSASDTVMVTVLLNVGVEDEELPQEVALGRNYPNPFNPSTTIRYGLPASGEVRLVVYDLLGRVVETLVDGVRPAGWHEVSFGGVALSSGTYLYRLETSDRVITQTMVLLK